MTRTPFLDQKSTTLLKFYYRHRRWLQVMEPFPPGGYPSTPAEVYHQITFWQWALYGNAWSPGNICPVEEAFDYGESPSLYTSYRILEDEENQFPGPPPPPPPPQPMIQLHAVPAGGSTGKRSGNKARHQNQQQQQSWNNSGNSNPQYYHPSHQLHPQQQQVQSQNPSHKLTLREIVPIGETTANHKHIVDDSCCSGGNSSSTSSSSQWYDFQTDLVSGDCRLELASRPSAGGGNGGGRIITGQSVGSTLPLPSANNHNSGNARGGSFRNGGNRNNNGGQCHHNNQRQRGNGGGVAGSSGSGGSKAFCCNL